LWKEEKDLDDLRVGPSPGAADETPIRELVENLPHDVKREQARIGLTALGCPSSETRRSRIYRLYAAAKRGASRT
jgi:hypothetical protein